MGNSCNKIQPAAITPVLALGSVASPYYVQISIAQRLCYPTCVDNTPVFNPSFSVKTVSQVAETQYVITLHVEGIISYVQCHGGCSCTKQQPMSQDFTIPVSKTGTAPVVTITQGATVNAIATVGCRTCGRNLVSETPLTITIA